MARAIDRGRAAGIYEGSLRAIVHAFKYDGRRSLARPIAALMRRHADDLLDGIDWTVPVPLHWRRERERGFNQAADLARALGLPVLHALRRVRATTVQADLPAARRHKNVRDAFALREPRWLTWSRGRMHDRVHDLMHDSPRPHGPMTGRVLRLRNIRDALQGTCVLLVDDVSTTGATLEACARVLKTAGVREARALTAARVVTRPSR